MEKQYKVIISSVLPIEDVRKLDELAKETGLSKSEHIRRAIRAYLEKEDAG